MDISSLKEGTKKEKVDVSGVVARKEETRTVNLRAGGTAKVAKVLLKDSSGQIALVLWNEDIDRVSENSLVAVSNGYVTNWKGELQLNVGKFRKFTVDGN